METNAFIFLDRRWEVDESKVTDALDYYAELKQNYKILFFPEGTDYCKNSKSRSDIYAEKNRLPIYQHVLHPRFTGFRHFVQHMKSKKALKSVYDITLGYPDRIVQNELQFAKGEHPHSLCFHIKRYDVEKDLPASDEDLQRFLSDLWEKKEKKLDKFFASAPEERRLEAAPSGAHRLSAQQRIFLAFSVFFWLSTSTLWIYWLFTLRLMWLYVLFATSIFCLITRIYGGIELFELCIWKSRHLKT